MNLLFDQNVPAKLRAYLQDHEIKTAAEMDWSTLKNGDLLSAAESANFQIFITCDQSISYQQNLSGRAIGILLLDTNDWKIVRRSVRTIQAVLSSMAEGEFATLNIARR